MPPFTEHTTAAPSPRPTRALPARAAARLILAAAALGAGAIHLSSAPEHLREYLPLGVGFLAAGLLQVIWGLFIVLRDSTRALRLGGVFSLAFIGGYLMSRTVGLPFGPQAFQSETFGSAGLLCCALEVPVAVGALLLARRPGALRAPLGMRLAAVAVGSLLLVGAATTFALAAPAHGHGTGHGTEAPCPASPVLTGVRDGRGVDTGITSYFSCRLLHEHDSPHH